MEILRKFRFFFNVVVFSLCAMFFSIFEVHSTEKKVGIDSGYEEKYMLCNNQESLLQVIDVAIKIISQESTIETQLEESKDLFDEAEPHYPKNGHVNRYYFSHNKEINMDIFKDKISRVWNSAYISFGACGGRAGSEISFDFDYIIKAKLSFDGVYKRESAYPNANGRRMVYKFNVARYRYKNNVIIDFKLNDENQRDESYPLRFSKIHIYI